MMELKVIIIEDEQRAANDLAVQLTLLEPDIKITGMLDSVSWAVKWLSDNPTPNLIFMDIHLGDGNCFEIFDQVEITCPVIFCTAYDEYALEAFKLSSIGYIVKPVDKQMLGAALQKYRSLEKHYVPSAASIQSISRIVQQPNRYKTSFLLPFKSKMVPLPVNNIACIYTREDCTYIVTADDELVISKTLEQLQIELDPAFFYRVNRQYIVAFSYIKEIEQLAGRKIGIILTIPFDEPIVVSKDAASAFKAWMEQR